ncbi:MAG TPA: hypothetical protein VMB34_01555 [Acetobacteraceae bacterium]|nr:hypothetical protein [Acetobacteraceae bacterium]
MILWFRRSDPDEGLEAEGDEPGLPGQIDFGEPVEPIPEGRLLPNVPEFAVIIAAAATNGWHMAAVVTDATGPEFYLRAIAVRWPFVVARPTPSTRIADRPVDHRRLSPTGSTPARKLIVNWGWTKLEDSFSQLRFYIKRSPVRWVKPTGRARLRLTLKESGWPRRRIVVPVKTNVINWDAPAAEKPASQIEKST